MLPFALALLLAQDSFKVEKSGEAVVVSSASKEVLRYQLKKPVDSKLPVQSACYFHPLTTPSGAVLTDVAPADHKHHRGIFLAWFEMKGKKDADFWGWGQFAPVEDRVIVNREVRDLSGGDGALFHVKNDWMAENLPLVREDLSVTFVREPRMSILDLVYVLIADGELRMPQRAFSGFCARLRKDGKATVESPGGEVQLPAPHHLKPESDWPAQPWYGYQIALPDGAQIGCAVMNHPKNPKSMWHNAASIRMLNPCIVAPGEVTMKAGEPLKLRYRVAAWDGPVPRERLDALSKGWANQP
jgi:hypothetical protein